MSTFTVLNLDDSGIGSLRQAILDANVAPGADVIDFAPQLKGTITLASELSITDDLTIDGPGEDQLTISGDGASRVMHIAQVSVTIADLTIANGFATGSPGLGGGILNEGGSVRVKKVTFTNNQAAGSMAGGGAIANVSKGLIRGASKPGTILSSLLGPTPTCAKALR